MRAWDWLGRIGWAWPARWVRRWPTVYAALCAAGGVLVAVAVVAVLPLVLMGSVVVALYLEALSARTRRYG